VRLEGKRENKIKIIISITRCGEEEEEEEKWRAIIDNVITSYVGIARILDTM
jgi:hypothetical protein